MVSWIRKWKVGCGLMGEQGAESIHRVFNEIRRSYCSMPNAVDRLKRILTEHHLKISPTNIMLQPPVKRRKSNPK